MTIRDLDIIFLMSRQNTKTTFQIQSSVLLKPFGTNNAFIIHIK